MNYLMILIPLVYQYMVLSLYYIYSLVRKEKGLFRAVTFEDVVERKFLYSTYIEDYKLRELFIIGYYSGMTFLNLIGVSEQVPAVLEITTNNTSSNKRLYSVGKRRAILRKGKTTLVVSSRASTVMNMDKIIVLNDGYVEGFDTPNNLFKTSPTYKRMVLLQQLESESAPIKKGESYGRE